jgi:septal ring factor EnvC (AmiA/AmiB activator)
MTPLLVKGLQDLHGMCKMDQAQRDQILARITAQEKTVVQHGRDIASLQKENQDKEKEIQKLKKENDEIKARLEKIEKLLLKK